MLWAAAPLSRLGVLSHLALPQAVLLLHGRDYLQSDGALGLRLQHTHTQEDREVFKAASNRKQTPAILQKTT